MYMKEVPFIHIFKTPKENYIYDVNTNSILKVQSEIYKILVKYLNNGLLKDDEMQELDKLKKQGYLKHNPIETIVHADDSMLEDILNRKISSITLQITQQCNLRCSYCVYSGSYLNRTHSDKIMDLELAKKGVDFLIDHSLDSKRLNIGFYGGEPLLRYNIIKEIVEYAKTQIEGKELHFSITTNGTLLNTDMVKYFAENNVGLTVSLDGPEEIHDKNRRFAETGEGSFKTIIDSLNLIKKEYPEYFNHILFNAVIDPRTDISCTNEFFANFDMISDAYINASVINLDNAKKEMLIPENYFYLRNYDLFKLFLSKLGRINEKHVGKLTLPYFDTLKHNMCDGRYETENLPRKVHHSGPCIPGAHKLMMDINGNFYPCERINETSEAMNIGSIYEGFDYLKIRRILNIGELTEDECRKCWAFRFCTLCAAAADDNGELSRSKKLEQCQYVIKHIETSLKEYCMLIEKGFHFPKKLISL